MKEKLILVINSGSATIKFKIFLAEKNSDLVEVVTGIIERIGLDNSFLEIKEATSKNFIHQNFPGGLKTHEEAFIELAKKIKNYIPNIKYAGHRVVHGGEDFVEATLLDVTSLQRLKKFNKLAPLHNPINLACAEKAIELMPEAKQFAICDTAYYKTIPDYIYLYPLPEEFYREHGIRRYGFHGISHKYAARTAAKKIKQPLKKLKIVTCHLGSGCSLTATKNGEAIGTTMGFTPLEGLMMSTRVGDLDAAVPLYMIDKLGLNTAQIDKIFNKQSGLLAVAGTMDMREILAAAGKKVLGYDSKKQFTTEEKVKAVLALKMFIYHIVRYIGQFTAVMKGLDLIVFTGGIGERSPVIRQMVLNDVRHLGKFKSLVIPADEELMIAQEVRNKVSKK